MDSGSVVGDMKRGRSGDGKTCENIEGYKAPAGFRSSNFRACPSAGTGEYRRNAERAPERSLDQYACLRR